MDELTELPDRGQLKPAVYRDLETFLKRQGHFDKADKVFTNMKIREFWEDPSWLHRVWNLLLLVTVNHGRTPELAFLWGGGILFIGSRVFRKDVMKLREPPGPKDPGPKYSAFWYSFDLFLPLVELHEARVWVPKNDYPLVLHYMRVHMILGWILIPIGLAAFTGIIE